MKSAFPSFSLVLFTALVSFTLVSHSPQGKGENIKKVKTYWEEVWGKGNLQAVADFYHPQAKHGEDFSIEGFQKGVSSLRTAFPDFKVTINDIFATGNKVITEVTYTGTHTGKKYFKQVPLGKTVKVPGIDIFTFENGKCVNHQHVADHLDLVMQMGLQLTPTSTDKKNN
jgi:predicted ester cyclase